MGADEAVWADVRRAHDLGEEPAAVFCRRLGVSESAYYARRKRLGWPVRPKIGGKLQSQPQPLAPSPQKQKQAAPRDDLAGQRVPPANRNNQTRLKNDTSGAALATATAAASTPGRQPNRRKDVRRKLTARLYHTIEQELEQLETLVAEGRVETLSELEKRSRTLMTMIRSLEKVLELDAEKPKKSGKGTKRSGGRRKDNIAELREEIAQRLERLHTEWEHSTGSEDARPQDD